MQSAPVTGHSLANWKDSFMFIVGRLQEDDQGKFMGDCAVYKVKKD